MQHRLNAHIGPKRERIVFCEVCFKTDPDLDTECWACSPITLLDLYPDKIGTLIALGLTNVKAP